MAQTASARASSVLCWLFLLLLYTPSVYAALGKWEATNFCKCICFGTNYTILPMSSPDDPSKPCLSCTKQWCLNQNLAKCAGASIGDTNPDTATGKEGDIEARCFQRDSPRDQLVVTLFLLTVFGLLLGAGIKGRMVKAGFDAGVAWSASRRWWEVSAVHARPLSRRPEDIRLGATRGFTRDGRGTYETVADSPPNP
ncbi:uncharacterized protein BXZ73DRAFT_87299 [Epithele typhae]|uniref:uncharacterized protein n=1 Tax=Epithele typhae TaxID=378194 RepID=UPI002007B6BD|nr:uncharacterized protein BXZ73DRAFT_87299 [Epithele typhae]KAH9944392.1 hypothetical protein BXZ73DRAFT_87299 [Epithele typhae]